MAKDNKKKARDKAAEKAVKARLGGTHLKSFRILGSEKDPESGSVTVHISAEGYESREIILNTKRPSASHT